MHRRLVEEYGEGPFDTIAEHDEAIIKNHNRVVSPKDDVYVLGDVFLGPRRMFAEYINQLNGRLHLLLGNHDDRMNIHQKNMFVWAKDLYLLKAKDGDRTQKIMLCHYPMRSWPASNSGGSWMLHGHTHNSLFDNPRLLSFCVSANAIGYTPMSFEQVKARMRWIFEHRQQLLEREGSR